MASAQKGKAAPKAARIISATDASLIGKTFTGRRAWLGLALSAGGKAGVSRLEHASTSMPFYVYQLRQELGEDVIQTEFEKHGGNYAGKHARYTFTDPLLRFEQCDPPKKAKPADCGAIEQASNPSSNTGSVGGSDER